LVPFGGGAGALWLIGWRVVQGVGGAMLFANSTAILTDAFPAHQRGLALGTNQVSAIAGSFLGLVLGGVLAEWDWRAVFWVSVPIAVIGAIWSYRSLHDSVSASQARSTGGGTSPSRSGSARCWPASSTASTRTAGTRPVGPTPGC